MARDSHKASRRTLGVRPKPTEQTPRRGTRFLGTGLAPSSTKPERDSSSSDGEDGRAGVFGDLARIADRVVEKHPEAMAVSRGVGEVIKGFDEYHNVGDAQLDSAILAALRVVNNLAKVHTEYKRSRDGPV